MRKRKRLRRSIEEPTGRTRREKEKDIEHRRELSLLAKGIAEIEHLETDKIREVAQHRKNERTNLRRLAEQDAKLAGIEAELLAHQNRNAQLTAVLPQMGMLASQLQRIEGLASGQKILFPVLGLRWTQSTVSRKLQFSNGLYAKPFWYLPTSQDHFIQVRHSSEQVLGSQLTGQRLPTISSKPQRA